MPLRIAFLLLVHKDAPQVERLVRRLDCAEAQFFIHVDLKAVGLIEALAVSFSENPQVHFTRRVRVDWGWGGHRAALVLLREALPFSPDFLILLSGQDYPLRRNDELVSFLESQPGRSFIHFGPIDRPGLGMFGDQRISRWWFRFRGRFLPIPGRRIFDRPGLTPLWNSTVARLPLRRRFLKGLRPYGGAQWWCLSAGRAEQCLSYIDAHPAVLRFYDRTFIPEEQIMQTVIANTSHEDVVAQNLHFVRWARAEDAHPLTLSEADLPAMLSSPALFARKFDAGSPVLDLLDQHIDAVESPS